MEQIADRLREIETRQAKVSLLLKLISKPNLIDAKDRSRHPEVAKELDEELKELLIKKVEELQGVHSMDAAICRSREADESVRRETSEPQPQPTPRPSKGPVPTPEVKVEEVLEDFRNDLSAEVSAALDAGISDAKRAQIARLLVSNGFAPAGDTRRAPGQVALPSKEGLEYANLAALNEHSGRVSLTEQMTEDLLSGRDTGSSRIDTNIPE